MNNQQKESAVDRIAKILAEQREQREQYQRKGIVVNTHVIRDGWESFASRVIPPNAGPAQRLDMERAFMAGAHVMYFEMLNLPESDAVAEAKLQAIDNEIMAYIERVANGTA